ncbi:hypothetical protein ACES2J_08270 [Bdellovibrio bacteriovorus]|uniref:hypothetical protein n=1 Tax=Bdellovibrio bacteriovorus TaxID=959 RepID=UPI0035A5F865
MTREYALETLKFFQDLIGLGYHPDTPMDEYINVDNDEKTFVEGQAADLQFKHDAMMNVLGDEAYDIAADRAFKLLNQSK